MSRVTTVGWQIVTLEALDLSHSGVGDATCRQIQLLSRLKRLALCSCDNVTDSGVLDISKVWRIAGTLLDWVGQGVKLLLHLDISGCKQLSDVSTIAIGERLPLMQVNPEPGGGLRG